MTSASYEGTRFLFESMLGCSPGVEAWLLEEDEFAELEPRDLRGAEAATAANTKQTWMKHVELQNDPRRFQRVCAHNKSSLVE